jgi:mono/diheme cytochrome c family protein
MTTSHSQKRAQRRAKRQTENRRKAVFRALIVLAIIALVVYLFLSTNQLAEPQASAAVLALGADVYAETCASCHGDQGQGHVGVASAPALDSSEHAWHHPDGQLQAIITSGGTLMPAFGEQLNQDEIVAVIRFMQTWWTADQLAAQQTASQSNPIQ